MPKRSPVNWWRNCAQIKRKPFSFFLWVCRVQESVCHRCVLVLTRLPKNAREKSVGEIMIIIIIKKNTQRENLWIGNRLVREERKRRGEKSPLQLATCIFHSHTHTHNHHRHQKMYMFFFVHGYKSLDRIDTVGWPCRERKKRMVMVGQVGRVAYHIQLCSSFFCFFFSSMSCTITSCYSIDTKFHW